MKSFTKQLRENWPLLIFIGGLIVTWTTFGSRLSQAEADIKDLKDTNAEIVNIKIQLQRIDTTVQFIKEKISDK